MKAEKSIIKVTCPSCKKEFQHFLPFKSSRTNRQNRYYWKCVVGIPAEHYGYYPEEMHDAYKMMFLEKSGEGPLTLKSTTKMQTDEFSEYVERCKHWAAEQGFYIPDPE